MSEKVCSRICNLAATPKHREVWRNIALVSWIFGVCPSILAEVVTHGIKVMFAVLVSINVVFIIINCSFCCVTIQTLQRKRVFYITCLVFMIANDAVLITSLVDISESTFQIIGFAGCGLVSVSCLAFVILNVLLIIQGPLDPVVDERMPQPTLDLPEDLPQGYVAIRYVYLRRGMLSSGTTFQVQSGQVLSLPDPGDTTTNTGQSEQQPASRSRRPFRFSFRSRSRDRENDARNMPIRIISDGVYNPERRGSAISLLRRASTTSSIEYDNAAVRCTCFSSPNHSSADDEEAPEYSQSPTGNISDCPIHGINSITPPAYEGSSAYNPICVPGLPKYDDVIGSKSNVLTSISEFVAHDSMSSAGSTSARANEIGNPQLLDRFQGVHARFETIAEVMVERSNSTLSQQIPPEPVTSTLPSTETSHSSSSTTDIPPTSPSDISPTTDIPPTTTDILPTTTTTTDIPPTSPSDISPTDIPPTTTDIRPTTTTTTDIPPTTTTTDIPPTSPSDISPTTTDIPPTTTDGRHNTSTDTHLK